MFLNNYIAWFVRSFWAQDFRIIEVVLQVVANEILKFLDVNRSYGPLLLHGFSVGGYLWGEALVQMERERERYDNVISRIAGQVWDSVADVETISVGLPFAVFPNSAMMRSVLTNYTV